MRRRLSALVAAPMKTLVLIAALVALLTVPASAGGASSTPLITGGAEDVLGSNGPFDLDIAINAVRHGDQTSYSGKINYVLNDVQIYASVECAGSVALPAAVGVGVGVAAGPQRDNPSVWTLVFVEDYGDYDEVSVLFVPEGQARANCAAPQPLAAIPVTDNGEFHVRT